MPAARIHTAYLFTRWAEPIAAVLLLKHRQRGKPIQLMIEPGGVSDQLWSTLLNCFARDVEEEPEIRSDLELVKRTARTVAAWAEVSRALVAIADLGLAELDRYPLVLLEPGPAKDAALERANEAVLAARQAYCALFDPPACWQRTARAAAAQCKVQVSLTFLERDALNAAAKSAGVSLATFLRDAAMKAAGMTDPQIG